MTLVQAIKSELQSHGLKFSPNPDLIEITSVHNNFINLVIDVTKKISKIKTRIATKHILLIQRRRLQALRRRWLRAPLHLRDENGNVYRHAATDYKR